MLHFILYDVEIVIYYDSITVAKLLWNNEM